MSRAARCLAALAWLLPAACSSGGGDPAVCDPACQSWQQCVDGRCAPTPDGCKDDADCRAGEVCDTSTNRCEPLAAYRIGHRSAVFSDPARAGHQVPVEIYYPAAEAGDDVPLLAAGSYGLVVFGHGRMGPVEAYANIWTALVAAGLVAALPRTEMGQAPDHEALAADLVLCAQRIRTGDPDGAFAGRIGKPAVMGHSMGGAVAFMAADLDASPFEALAVLSPGSLDAAFEAAERLELPGLLLGGTDDCLTPIDEVTEPLFELLGSTDKTLIRIQGAGHCQFSEPEENCELARTRLCGPEEPDPSLSREAQHELSARLLAPWLASRLAGDTGAAAAFEQLLEQAQGFSYRDARDEKAGSVSRSRDAGR
ncbi:MAG: hypothetical protein JXR96_22640 [Deltaproteobacteria bacterium]|nr:hypothetical protein [Deltaproteobacteria bacterium]